MNSAVRNLKNRVHGALREVLPLPLQARIQTFHQGSPAPREMEEHLRKLSAETEAFLRRLQVRPRLRILWSPGFNILPVFWVHDGLLAMALRLRGAEVIPLMCDGIQPRECSVYGGVWGHYGEEGFAGQRWRQCNGCSMADLVMWDRVWGLPPVKLSNYTKRGEPEAIWRIVQSVDAEAWSRFEYDGLPVGRWAKDLVLNMNLMGYLDDFPLALESARNYMYDVLILRLAYGRILDKYRPDRVISHDNFFSMWGVLCSLAERRGIPFFTYYTGALPGTWNYTRNGVTCLWSVDAAWPAWRDQTLSAEQQAKLDKYMAERRSGRGLVYSAIPTGGGGNEELGCLLTSGFDMTKPTAMLAANVVWDAAAVNQDLLFDVVFEWVHETIRYFAGRPDLQLIIKPHPGEEESSIPETRHKVLGEIEKAGIQVPRNVFLLPPKTAITAYELFPYIGLGLVHTGTLGLELSMAGIPVIVAAKAPYRGKGFTIDPPTREAYFEAIDRVLTTGEPEMVVEDRIRQSRAYFYLQYFHFFVDHKLCSWEWDRQPVVKVQSAEELLPGANKHLDYVCDSIINDLPILSADRWPPES